MSKVAAGILATILSIGSALAQSQADAERVRKLRPADEAAIMLNEWVRNSSKEAKAAPNDIAREPIEKKWEQRYCDATNKLKTFKEWTGLVWTIKSTGYFEVKLDADDLTRVYELDLKPGTPIFNVISTLREKQAIKMSGTFVQPVNHCASSMVFSAEFRVNFTKIEPL